jgi:hypothetical protein
MPGLPRRAVPGGAGRLNATELCWAGLRTVSPVVFALWAVHHVNRRALAGAPVAPPVDVDAIFAARPRAAHALVDGDAPALAAVERGEHLIDLVLFQ